MPETRASVAYMETGNARTPTPEEARTALAQADAEESATINRPVPGWYFPVLAALVFVVFSLNAVEDSTGFMRVGIAVLALTLAAAAGWLIYRVTLHQPGYKGIHVQWGPTISVAIIALAFPVAALVLDGLIGSWVWIVAGAALAVLILILGMSYQRRHRRG